MFRIFLLPFLLSFLLQPAFAIPGQIIRIELPGKGKILTLAEVEVFVDGTNVAPQGTTKQSSLASGGDPERAIDGNKDPGYSKNGQTHTSVENNPWWEIDLGKEVEIERIDIWNRGDRRT